MTGRRYPPILSHNTTLAYDKDLAAFVRWAHATGRSASLPVSPVDCADWLAEMESDGLAASTIRRRVRGLAHHHRSVGLPSPSESDMVKRQLRGICDLRNRQVDVVRKRPMTASIIARAWRHLSVRDRAILVVGIMSGLRRSELVALRWIDVDRTSDGYRILVRRSKEDQAGRGRWVHLTRSESHMCPVRALAAWRARKEQDYMVAPDDRIFSIGDSTVARVVKRAAELAGEDPAEFAGHSLRAGMITTAAETGSTVIAIRQQSGHRTLAGVAVYVRPQDGSPLATDTARGIAGNMETASK